MFFGRLLPQTLLALLFSAFGTVAVFAAPGDWTRISYPVVAQELSALSVNLTNTARAPPTIGANLTSTGTALAQTANLRTMEGAEATGAVYAILRSSNATNSADEVTDLFRGDGRPHAQVFDEGLVPWDLDGTSPLVQIFLDPVEQFIRLTETYPVKLMSIKR